MEVEVVYGLEAMRAATRALFGNIVRGMIAAGAVLALAGILIGNAVGLIVALPGAFLLAYPPILLRTFPRKLLKAHLKTAPAAKYRFDEGGISCAAGEALWRAGYDSVRRILICKGHVVIALADGTAAALPQEGLPEGFLEFLQSKTGKAALTR